MTDEELEKLEQSEHEDALAALAAITLLISTSSNDLSRKLYFIYDKYGMDGILTWAVTNKRINGVLLRTKMFSEADEILTSLFTGSESEFRKLLEKTIRKEYISFGVDLTDEQLQKILDYKWGADALNWKDRLWNRKDKTLFDLEKSDKQSLIRKDSFSEVDTNKQELMDKLNRSIRTLLITEQSAIGSRARRLIFEELGVKHYRFYAREDERTCEYCGSLHGLVFPVSAWQVGVTASPIHTSCRCWEVPVFD